MNAFASSCELPGTTASGPASSHVLHLGPDFRWQGVPVAEYKADGDGWARVARMVLVGERNEKTSFQVRYFEIAPGGFSSLETHAHEHAVVVLRGSGQVQLGSQIHDLGFGATVYVAPHEPHQFRNPSAVEPFGFLCIVDAQRDRPVAVTAP